MQVDSTTVRETDEDGGKGEGAGSSREKKEKGSQDSSRSSSADRTSPPLVARTALEEKLKSRGHAQAAEIKKSLNLYETTEDKLEALVAAQAALLEEKRLMQKTLKEQHKIYTLTAKKLDQKEKEYQKTALAKVKLEELCRELQKCNRAIKEENLERLKQHEHSRQEMVEQFRRSLSDIQQTMDTGKDRSERLADDNQQLAAKLKTLAEQYENKEDYAKQMVAAKDVEVKLYETKMQAAQLQVQKIAEEKLRSEHALLLKLKERDEQLQETLAAETELREQIGKYSSKYDDLHRSLSSSNQTFDRFKHEMERMNGSLVKVERESRKWRAKFEEASQSLAGTVTQKKESDDRLAQKQRQLDKLQNLCRTLQDERAQLLKQLKVEGESGVTESVADGEGDEEATVCDN